ncbi:MAG: electron transport complex subunit RsxC [Clostridiales bacterium]|jgi:electron transport complex protein RnfC|nr:electron transport complex subunit RsxC [Clostridiales bacterium]
MKSLTFPRGIHPSEKKNTAHKPVVKLSPAVGELLTFPMSQHIGAPAEPIVNVGDRVLLGQKLGDSAQPLSSPVHSSVSGVVKSITQTLTPTGITCQAVIVENDGEDNAVGNFAILDSGDQSILADDGQTPDRDKVLQLIREAGVVGLGGAGFPTHIKLNPPKEKAIDTIIVNASECEPYLTTDHRAMLDETERLISGLKIILSLFPGAKGLIGVETNKADAIEKLLKVARNESDITIVPLKPKYPQGAEKQLIYTLTKREVPSGGLPADIGCIVDNVDTVIAIERAVHRRRPLIRRVITVDGGAAKNPGNYEVRLGTSYSSLIEHSGGFVTPPCKLISGGPMMGVAMFTLDVPVTKTSSAILCFTDKEAYLPPEKNCVRCGRCVDHCPARLMPLELNQYVIAGEMDEFVAHNGKDCIECGSCSYVCPSKRHLAQSIRAARRQALAAPRK